MCHCRQWSEFVKCRERKVHRQVRCCVQVQHLPFNHTSRSSLQSCMEPTLRSEARNPHPILCLAHSSSPQLAATAQWDAPPLLLSTLVAALGSPGPYDVFMLSTKRQLLAAAMPLTEAGVCLHRFNSITNTDPVKGRELYVGTKTTFRMFNRVTSLELADGLYKLRPSQSEQWLFWHQNSRTVLGAIQKRFVSQSPPLTANPEGPPPPPPPRRNTVCVCLPACPSVCCVHFPI